MRQGLFKLKKISKMKANGTFVTHVEEIISLSIAANIGSEDFFTIWTYMSFKKFLEYLSEIDGGEFFFNYHDDRIGWSGYIEDGDIKLHFAGTWKKIAEEAIKVHGIQLAKHICKEITTLELEIESVSFINSEIKGNDAK